MMDISIAVNPGKRAACLNTQMGAAPARQRTADAVPAQRDKLIISREAQAAQAVETAAEDGSGALAATTFPAFSEIFAGITKGYTDTVRAHYAQEHMENLSYDNPAVHIWDKYKNQDSPYFRADMPEDERAWAYDQELDLFNGGKHLQMSNPYAFGEPPTLASAAVQAMQVCREEIDQSIQALFAENGIEVPADASFRLTVEQSDYSIHVTGLEDEELTETIERALNRGDNGKNLYDHLELTVSDGEEPGVEYVGGHLAEVDTARELDNRALSEVKKQAGPTWARYSATYDPHQEAMNEKILSLDPDSPLCTQESKDRLSAAVRVGAPEVIAEFRTRQQDVSLMITPNTAVDPDGSFSPDVYAKAYAQSLAQHLSAELGNSETDSNTLAYAVPIDGLEISRAAHRSAMQAVQAVLAQLGNGLLP